ncbi:acyl-CoA thioesterase [Jeotgalibacillus soli]|uniref:Uncharacterized protein n=1 Tax=Jeotgalibacillus soli TaxID=889306 RepID=A0A0C2RSA2_9BACL|nr:acyl-CoA thioesterase [Jeotgalibacillus soli]KIL44624.1 hypothetical protein KP78_35880 [Jeotgalibacillus soli]
MRVAYIQDIEKWEKEFIYYHEVSVRFSETDLFGHLNNTVTFVYFEQARIEFFKAIGFMQEWVRPEHETIPVVANLQCDYLQQVYFDQKLKVYVKMASVGKSSADVHYKAVNEKGATVFVGRGTVVQMSKKTGKGHAWTEEQKARLITSDIQHT